jgi:bifunctional non-homologous end joining protein LigD
VSAVRPTFLHPSVPIPVKVPPTGDLWIHQPKLDGYRCVVVKDRAKVRLYSRRGNEFHLPGMAAALANLAADTAVLDTELISVHADGRADFYALKRAMRSSSPDESAMMLMVFDLLWEWDVDLRGLPLSERLRDLQRLLRKSRVPCLKLVESFPDGPVLLEHCERMELEGIVSKRKDKPYVSGVSKHWQKTKCESWRGRNQQRYKILEKPPKPPAPTERERTLQRRKAELARVRESLARPGLREA